MESITTQNHLSDFIIEKIKEIKQLQNNIKLDDLGYTTKRRKYYSFSKYLLSIVSWEIHEGNMSLEDPDKE